MASIDRPRAAAREYPARSMVDLFAEKMTKVRDVLSGEGFAQAEVRYEAEAGIVRFVAPGAIPFQMRRQEFDAKTDLEVAFFVAHRMRRPEPVVTKKR
jgi:hypothetical protein